MKLSKKKICSGFLAGMLSVMSVLQTPILDAQADTASEPFVTEIPGTTHEEKELDGSFLSVSGFAKGNVHARSEYKEGMEGYAVVNNETEFLQALRDAENDKVKVIEIRADLNLGWYELTEDDRYEYEGLIEPYLNSQGGSAPVGNPVLIESGISTITVDGVDGLTIFSTTGNTLKHAEFKFNSEVNDLVIRNLRFDEVWEWDDWRNSGLGTTGGRGNRKRTGWTNIKLNGCNNVWIDHCTLGNSFDGNIDVENGSAGITISWCKIGDDNVAVGSVIYKTAMYLEELYQQSKLKNSKVDSFNIYRIMRDNGMTVEQIMKFMSQHDKCHLGGAGDADSWLYDKGARKFLDEPNYEKTDANEKIRLSLAYNYYSDIGQRLPMIRSGMGHLYNCYIDDWDIAEVYKILNSDPKNTGMTIANQIKVNGNCVTLARGMDARDGASIAADTCVYYGAQTAITGTAYHPNGANIAAGFENTWKYNYALVVNSSFQKYGSDDVYVGSSWDNNGSNPFIEDGDYWNEGKDSKVDDRKAADAIIGKWKWRQAGVNTTPDGDTENLGYDYQTFPLEDVKENTEKYSGFRKIQMSAEDWLQIEYATDYSIDTIDPAVVVSLESVSLNKEVADLFMEEEFLQLDAEMLPYNTTVTPGALRWSSSDPSVARVNECGLVIPVTCGSATITVTAPGGMQDTCEVRVSHLPLSIEITGIPKEIYVGDILDLDAKISPEGVLDDTVIWENAGIYADILDAEKGIILAEKVGSNRIQVSANQVGNRVTTKQLSKSIALKIKKTSVYTMGVSVEPVTTVSVGETVQLQAQVLPENATNKNVVWTVSDSSIAVVDSDGKLTAVTAGATTLKVRTINGGYTAECILKVTTEPAVVPGTGEAVTGESVAVKKGDVNNDGLVKLDDAQLALRMALLLEEPSERERKAGDVNDSGKIDLGDAQKILRVALLLDPPFDEADESDT